MAVITDTQLEATIQRVAENIGFLANVANTLNTSLVNLQTTVNNIQGAVIYKSTTTPTIDNGIWIKPKEEA